MRAGNAHTAGRNTPERRNYDALNRLYQRGLEINQSLNNAAKAQERHTETADAGINKVTLAYSSFNNEFLAFQQSHNNLLQQVYHQSGTAGYNFANAWNNMNCGMGRTVLERMDRQDEPFKKIEAPEFNQYGAAAQMIGSCLSMDGDQQEYENIGSFIEGLNTKIADLEKKAGENKSEAENPVDGSDSGYFSDESEI